MTEAKEGGEIPEVSRDKEEEGEINANSDEVSRAQNAKAEERIKFLQFLQCMDGRKAVFTMHENTQVRGIFRAANFIPDEIMVNQLETPTGVFKSAVLRMKDIICIAFEPIDLGSGPSGGASTSEAGSQ
ncbi:unnamed protein product [Darwinula stevensoni]|uniref:Uncharacterized protein n=1 Tax=Darwinula stevensoni TaxID=69355 RepID=A0A7R8X571_9CRUS|nr:unnamed protein product [Darwinula stevensoni]CAG0880119.1 unnamed protein product [Darwinula stevensoni]